MVGRSAPSLGTEQLATYSFLPEPRTFPLPPKLKSILRDALLLLLQTGGNYFA